MQGERSHAGFCTADGAGRACIRADVVGHAEFGQQIKMESPNSGIRSVTCTPSLRLLFFVVFHTQVHLRSVSHWSKVQKGKAAPPPPPSSLYWNLTPVTSHGGLGFSRAVPAHPAQCVNKLSLRRISLPKPHCSIATAGNVLLESEGERERKKKKKRQFLWFNEARWME